MQQRVIALGFFDGVHLGHAALLRRTVEEARQRGCCAAVFTFDRLPREVITGTPCPQLNSPEDRQYLMRHLYGIQEILMVPFDHQMMTTPWDLFLSDLLVSRYQAVHLVAGHDHHFGHQNRGTPELLMKKCAELNLGCDIIPKVTLDGITVSSTRIRQLLQEGDVEEAWRFLGHPHLLTGTVRHGRGIGTSRLYPTANIAVPPRVLTPKNGVYVTRAVLADGRRCQSVTNVGTRPTVNAGTDITVEASLLDYTGDLYGQTVRLTFLQHLRDECAFRSVPELKAQISRDVDSARAWFAAHPESADQYA